jgi:ADP-heptose:LPS heptosyltransferase
LQTEPLARGSRVLLLLLPGLGDALCAGPIVRAANADGLTIDALTMLGPVTEYARALDEIDRVFELPLLDRPASALPGLAQLRRNRYAAAFLPFPATRWQYSAVAAAAGAKRLFTHDYGRAAGAIAKTANATIVPLRGGHRIFENRRLASAAGLEESPVAYLVPKSWSGERTSGLLGMHPGTMKYKGNDAKRLPLDRFVEVLKHEMQKGRRIRLFAGPYEDEDLMRIRGTVDLAGVDVVRASLAQAARALSECEVFVANDSGFAHLSAALGVKTVTIFGMTDPARINPIGPSFALRPSACPPCHDEGMRDFRCVLGIDYRCIREDVGVADISSAIDVAFTPEFAPTLPRECGPFRLYGKPHAS